MAKHGRSFPDESHEDRLAMHMSDAELEALMAGAERTASGRRGQPSSDRKDDMEATEPGARVRGLVIDVRGGEVLLELDSKTHGVVDALEFDAGELPDIGSTLDVAFVRFDPKRGLAILSVGPARKQILWESIHVGLQVEGLVTGVNKGGLTLDLKGIRGFLPLSQIDRKRVEDPAIYVGQRLRCEVTSFNRSAEDVVLSRRAILEREAEETRGKALARLSTGEVLEGTVTRISEHGALIDLGGVEGLLHQSKITARRSQMGGEALQAGMRIEVEVIRVDAGRGRVSLDFRSLGPNSWNRSIEGYQVGDEASGWVSRLTPDEAVITLDEGVEGFIPRRTLLDMREEPQKGNILRVRIAAVDLVKRRIELTLVHGTRE